VKILIVDDEQLDLFITKKLLSMQFEVEGFAILDDAVKWASQNTFDILLSDYYLADGIQAFEVLKAIKAAKTDSFKSFVLSNHIDEQQTAALLGAGFTGVIDKPITVEKFNEALQR